MKKRTVCILFLLFTVVANAQDRDEHREKIKALKTAHLTEGLELTSEEAQEFWPIYNAFEENRRALYRKERADIENLECMSQDEALEKLNEYVELEKQDFLLKKQYYEDLRKIFTPKKIMLLKQLEDEFNRELMRRYHARREKSK